VGGIPAGTHRTPAVSLKLGLSHAAMVPDLTMRDRCRGCGASGQVAVPVKWGTENATDDTRP
jgi:hypothetical protein